MNSSLADVFPATLIATWIAWLHAAVIYGAFRRGEKRWVGLPYWGLVPLALYFGLEVVPWLTMNPMGRNQELTRIGTYVLAALLGGFFHLRSGGASRHYFGAFLLMFETINFSVGPVLYAVGRNWLPLRSVPEPAIWAWMVGISFYPTFVPLVMCIWQSMRLRQGTDVPGEEE